jgi:hypothetical protein
MTATPTGSATTSASAANQSESHQRTHAETHTHTHVQKPTTPPAAPAIGGCPGDVITQPLERHKQELKEGNGRAAARVHLDHVLCPHPTHAHTQELNKGRVGRKCARRTEAEGLAAAAHKNQQQGDDDGHHHRLLHRPAKHSTSATRPRASDRVEDVRAWGRPCGMLAPP